MKQFSLILAFVLAITTCVAGSAYAVGTSGDTGVIYNGMFLTGDTVPNGAGRMAIRMKFSSLNADSRYAYITDGNTVAISVDTAYDLRTLYTPTDQSASAGDTAKYVYIVENLGNASILIDLDTERTINYPDSAWPIQNYRVIYDLSSDSLITTDSGLGSITLPAGAMQQIMVTVLVPDTAAMNESTHVVFRVSDRAPRCTGSATGDIWQSGVPMLAASATERDTQWDTVVTTVKGPLIKTGKTVREYTYGLSRPGDTLVFDITLDNDGNDSAYGVQVIDAVPDNTRYVPYSADSGIFLGNTSTTGTFTADSEIAVGLDSDPLGGSPTFNDSDLAAGGKSDTITIRSISWTLKSTMGEDNGDGATVNPDFNDGVYDAARVTFWVTIQ